MIAAKSKAIGKTALCAVFAMIFSAVYASANDPVEINSYDDFRRIGSSAGNGLPLNGSYVLTGDIDASASKRANGGLGWIPIGTAAHPFSGTFLGGGYAVHGLYINRPTMGNVGLFGYIDSSGVVMNLGVQADTIIGSHAVGVLAGVNYGHIINSYTFGYVNARRREESNVGGIAGVNGGSISKSYSAASVAGVVNAGGLVGFLAPVVKDGLITESYATGQVMGENFIGGLVGYIFGGIIDRCFSAGLVSVTPGTRGGFVGGLVGEDFNASNNSWNVRGRAGGRPIRDADIHSSFWDVDVSRQDTSKGGSGKTTEQMLDPETYEYWDFVTSWVVSEGTFYPQLRVSPMCTLEYRAADGGYITVGGIRGMLEHQEMVLGLGVSGLRVTAVGRPGFVFWRWDDGITTPAREDAFAEAGPQRLYITAQFIVPSFVLYEAGTGGKLRVGESRDPVDYYNDQKAIEGAVLPSITAVELEGYRFSRWSDGVTTLTRTGDIVPSAGDTLRIRAIFEFEGLPKRHVAFTGRNININAKQDVNTQIRVIDVRGRTVAQYAAKGSAKIPMKKIPAGVYVVEIQESGKRVNMSTVVLR
ncbi:MAG: T9SS type A sorting domain-containing protein [Chitinispirillia bacterium]|nr:T9SS type A sorting domain-containing protein [Chitinispirillia bacterium]